ncbi:MAG: hypothetical protein EZS28_042769, partial [Streblomastix strix]
MTTYLNRTVQQASFADRSSLSINVVVRARPLGEGESEFITVENDEVRIPLKVDQDGDNVFSFKRVFPPRASQTEVFTTIVDPIIQEALNGFNCTVFAYGQTSTGKTYTIHGNRNAPGMIVLSLRKIFNHLNNNNGIFNSEVKNKEQENKQQDEEHKQQEKQKEDEDQIDIDKDT